MSRVLRTPRPYLKRVKCSYKELIYSVNKYKKIYIYISYEPTAFSGRETLTNANTAHWPFFLLYWATKIYKYNTYYIVHNIMYRKNSEHARVRLSVGQRTIYIRILYNIWQDYY